MAPGHRKYLVIGLVVLAAGIVAGLGAATYYLNSAKPRLETIASTSLGMQASCSGLRVSLLPPSVLVRDVKISNNGTEVALIPTLQVRLDLLALLRMQLQISSLILKKPQFTLSRLENGTWNIETPKREKTETDAQNPFTISSLNIRDGRLVLRVGANPLEMRGLGLTARNLVLTAGNERLSLTGDFSCTELRYNDKTVIRNLTSPLQGSAGSFIFTPVTFQAFQGTASGKVRTDFGGESPIFGLQLELSRFQAEDFFASMTKEQLLRGEMDLVLDIEARGHTQHELLRSLSGNASMTGQNLTSIRFDLDNLMEEFIQSQQFDLVDLGAFMIVGPLGPALTKVFDFGMLANATHGGSTEVRKLVSLWRVDEGMAVARDVALATEKNRIAMRGKVDIADERFQNLVVAVIDAGGCALVHQEMDGAFDRPEVKKPSFIESAAGPLISIFKGTATFLSGEKCEVFYNGSVAAPGK